MKLQIKHSTDYQYSVPATYALLQIRMRPQPNRSQKILAWDLNLGGASVQTEYQDHNGNWVDLIALEPGAEQVELQVSGLVETTGASGVIGPHQGVMPLWYYKRQTPLTQSGTGVAQLVAQLGEIDADPLAGLHALSARIRAQVAYSVGATQITTRAEEALSLGQGVCQDHSHIFLAAARALGFSARYASGYLMMNDRVEQDASHAWAEVYLEALGWVGFDISNGISPDERYVQISYGLDYAEAAPTSGILIGAQKEQLRVSIQVQQ